MAAVAAQSASAAVASTAAGGGERDHGLRHNTAKLYVSTTKQRQYQLELGDRFEFALAVRDGMTIDARVVFAASGLSDQEETEILPTERLVATQGKYDCVTQGGGTLTIQLSNEFAWRALSLGPSCSFAARQSCILVTLSAAGRPVLCPCAFSH